MFFLNIEIQSPTLKTYVFLFLVSLLSADVMAFADGMGNVLKNKTIVDRMIVYFIESSDMYDDDELPEMKEEILTAYSTIDREYVTRSRFVGLSGSSWTVHTLELINGQLLDLAEKMIIYQQKSIEIFQRQLRKTIRHENGVQVAMDPDQRHENGVQVAMDPDQ